MGLNKTLLYDNKSYSR